MNRENLQKIADLGKNITKEKFDISVWRNGSMMTHKCKSVGCLIGYATILDKKENLVRRSVEGDIDFGLWGENFTGLSYLGPHWEWCFSASWSHTDNTPQGAVARIEYLLKKDLPDNWFRQMMGYDELCY